MAQPYNPGNTEADKDAYKKRKKFALEFSEYFFMDHGTKATVTRIEVIKVAHNDNCSKSYGRYC
jgi:hypothetical protein